MRSFSRLSEQRKLSNHVDEERRMSNAGNICKYVFVNNKFLGNIICSIITKRSSYSNTLCTSF